MHGFSMAHLLEHAPVKRLGIPFIKGGIAVGVPRALGVLVVPFEWKGHGFRFFLGLKFKCDIKFQAPKPWEFILRFASKKTVAGKTYTIASPNGGEQW